MANLTRARLYDPLLYYFVKDIRRGIVEMACEYSFGRIIDVCCGTGNQVKLLARKGFDATGIDNSEEMLSISNAGPCPGRCLKQDATALEFPDSSFDVAMITFGLHEKDPETGRKILAEMVRVVRDGGHVLVADYEFSDETGVLARGIITFIERIAGGDHYQSFITYLSGGCMTGLVPGGLSEIKTRYFASNGVAVRLFCKNG